jgi:hypothetical protein
MTRFVVVPLSASSPFFHVARNIASAVIQNNATTLDGGIAEVFRHYVNVGRIALSRLDKTDMYSCRVLRIGARLFDRETAHFRFPIAEHCTVLNQGSVFTLAIPHGFLAARDTLAAARQVSLSAFPFS